MSRLTLLAVTALLVLAGCTSSDGDPTPDGDGPGGSASDAPSSPTATAKPTGPDCADVWQSGETLPADYDACVTDGAYGLQEVTACKDGTRLVAYADTYYAISGGRISKPDVAPMQDTEEFGAAFSACTDE